MWVLLRLACFHVFSGTCCGWVYAPSAVILNSQVSNKSKLGVSIQLGLHCSAVLGFHFTVVVVCQCRLSQLNSDNTVVTEYGCLSNHATEKHLFQVHRQQDWLTTMCVFVCTQMGSVQELCSWSIHVVFKCNFQWNSMVISYYRITALWQPSVHSDIAFWSFDVRSSYYCDTLMLHFSRIYI